MASQAITSRAHSELNLSEIGRGSVSVHIEHIELSAEK